MSPVRMTATLRYVWFWSLVMGLYSTLIAFKNQLYPLSVVPDVTSGINTSLTIALGVLLVFRTNKAYERWWEARSLWGKQVNVSRNLAVKVRKLANVSPAEQDRVRKLVVAFAYALKDHLRGEIALRKIPGFETATERPQHIPGFIVSKIYSAFDDWQQSELISGFDLLLLDTEARNFLEVCGGCEKIKNTLMSQSWRTLARQVLFLYLIFLPWGLVETFRFLTIPLTVVASYLILAVEGISLYVERPFGHQEDHLDLDSICKAIEVSVNEKFQSEPDVGRVTLVGRTLTPPVVE